MGKGDGKWDIEGVWRTRFHAWEHMKCLQAFLSAVHGNFLGEYPVRDCEVDFLVRRRWRESLQLINLLDSLGPFFLVRLRGERLVQVAVVSE
jgi:hypothetical protein